MLVATPGQTTSYSIVHNNSSNGSDGNSTAAATSITKRSSNVTVSGPAKSLNNNSHHTAAVIASTKNSLNSNTHTTAYNYHQNPKSDGIASNKISNQNKATATASRDIISSTLRTVTTTHSLKNENSTNNNTTTTTSKQKSFIQTLKDSVQKALISTTGSSSSNNSISNKYSGDKKLHNNCNNSTTSIHVTSSSSSTSHNTNKVSTTTSSSNISSNLTTAPQTSSSVSVVRSKHFSCTLSKLYTVAPTALHRYPEERQNTSSTDSLQKEMCHFKPIRIVPKTPWKSGSKSRGNNLRFPKAKLATENTEFILKSNCDVNNRKRKQQQNRLKNKINAVEDDVDDNEQENTEFVGIYKPKPSLTCLSTSSTTPSHCSAFVCLVSQMKSLVNLQSKRQLLTSIKSAEDVVEAAADKTLKELFVRKRERRPKDQQNEATKQKVLPKARSTRLSISNAKNKNASSETATENFTKERVKRKNAKISISKASTVAITKAKSRRNSVRAKSKTANMVALAKEKLKNSISMPAVVNMINNTNTRKRKVAREDNVDVQHQQLSLPSLTKTTSQKSIAPGSRKSFRLSTKNTSATANSLIKHPTNVKNQQNTRNSLQKNSKNSSLVGYSPPLTRSRLKSLTEQELLRQSIIKPPIGNETENQSFAQYVDSIKKYLLNTNF